MNKIVIEFCNGEKVEATSVFDAVMPVYDFFMSLPATNEEKERYLKEAAEVALETNSDEIVYDPFVKVRLVKE